MNSWSSPRSTRRFASGNSKATNLCVRAARLLQHKARKVGFAILILACSSPLAGCVSRTKADDRARAAFFAGQQQAAMTARQTHLQGPTVTVIGEVRNAQLRWSADLTLAKAVIEAQYYGRIDPAMIVIQRDGKEIQCDPKKLLGGEDVQLQPYDVIELAH